MPKAAEPRKRAPKGRGQEPIVGTRMSPEMIEQIDAWATSQSLTRSEAIRQLIAESLKRKLS